MVWEYQDQWTNISWGFKPLQSHIYIWYLNWMTLCHLNGPDDCDENCMKFCGTWVLNYAEGVNYFVIWLIIWCHKWADSWPQTHLQNSVAAFDKSSHKCHVLSKFQQHQGIWIWIWLAEINHHNIMFIIQYHKDYQTFWQLSHGIGNTSSALLPWSTSDSVQHCHTLSLQVNVNHFVKHWVVYLINMQMTVSTEILNRNGWLDEKFASCIELSIETWVPPKFHAPVYGSVYDCLHNNTQCHQSKALNP